MRMPSALTRALRKISSAYPMRRSGLTEPVFAPLQASLAIDSQKESRFLRPAPHQADLRELISNIDDGPLLSECLTGNETPLETIPDGLRVVGVNFAKESEAPHRISENQAHLPSTPVPPEVFMLTDYLKSDETQLRHVPNGLRLRLEGIKFSEETGASQNSTEDHAHSPPRLRP
jgi:hypothetical protein